MPDNNQFGSLEEFLSGEQNKPEQTEEEKDADTPPEQDTAKTSEELTDEEKNKKDAEAAAATDTPPTKEKTKTPPAGQHNPMKELRDKASAAEKAQVKIDTAINRLSDGDYAFKLRDFKNEEGKIDYDKLIEAMDEADVKKRAESRGLTPEMQAEIEKYEREKKEVEIAKARVQMDRQLNNFQMEQQLSPEDLNLFISDSMKVGINPLSIAALDKTSKGTTALKLLYKAVYSDRLVKDAVTKALAEAEAKREADVAAKGGQPKSNPAGINNSKTNTTDPKGMALDDFLKTL